MTHLQTTNNKKVKMKNIIPKPIYILFFVLCCIIVGFNVFTLVKAIAFGDYSFFGNGIAYVPICEIESIEDDSYIIYETSPSNVQLQDIVLVKIDKSMYVKQITNIENGTNGKIYTAGVNGGNLTVEQDKIIGKYKKTSNVLATWFKFSSSTYGFLSLIVMPISIYVSVELSVLISKLKTKKMAKQSQNNSVLSNTTQLDQENSNKINELEYQKTTQSVNKENETAKLTKSTAKSKIQSTTVKTTKSTKNTKPITKNK